MTAINAFSIQVTKVTLDAPVKISVIAGATTPSCNIRTKVIEAEM
jgi:hypothetical protein